MAGSDFDPRTPEGVAHVARLARLALTDDEAQGLAAHMTKLLEAVDALQALEPDRSALEPSPLHALRDDVATASLPAGQALANAPREADGGFVVPAVLSES
ncbi:MAG: Asp-tRNA(Asn)/Glu-tRNA(Gln) amidotransferase subunit GatC [Planctomycetes bacterium]|nr:Asp-tRNA(Asn)/Glu-tRNA(Gln) amidotransferase subunit GatC [Planctomycetota bacterium]